MMRKMYWGLSILLSSVLCICSYAQNTNGTILGAVVDSTNAMVPNAKITAINTGTQARTSATSGSDGSFSLHVPPGSYDVTVEAPGFQTFKASAVQVLVNEDSRVQAVLHPGAAVQVVTVSSINTHIDTTSATLKNVVGEQTIQSMPLNGRNPISLVLLVPGVTRDPNASVTSGATYPSIGGISINGTRSNSTNYILDGASDNDNYTNAPNPYPDPDALQEFSVQTNNFSAEFGRLAGGVVNVVTKSGTNQIHGSAFEYIRNNYFNAANHYSAVANGHKSDDGLKRNQFGGTLGGPIALPRIYDGKDRSFFFASYQGTIVHQRPNARSAVVPDAKLRSGDFSELSKSLYVPYDPGRSTFANNRITQIDPVAQYMLKFIPAAPAGTPVNSQGGQTIFYTGLNNSLDNQINARIDHRFSDKDTLYGTFFNSQDSSPGLLDLTNILSNEAPVRRLSRRVLASDTHIFSPHLLNQALFSYDHDHYWETPITPPESLTKLGVDASVTPIAGQYKFAVSSYFSISTADTNQFFRDEYQGIDTVRYTHGNHQISFGGEYTRGTGNNINNYQQDPIYTFTASSYTPNPNTVATSTGNSFADYLLGRFSGYKQGAGEYKNTRFNHIAAFAEDTWRVNSRLVLVPGARYEPFFPYTDTHNRLAAWRPGQQSTIFPNAPVGVVFPGDRGIPSGAFNKSWGNLGPRVGFAYDVAGNGKTSIHGGYGIFFDLPNTITTNNMTDQAPFAPVITLNGTSQNSVLNPYGGTTNPFPFPTFPASPAQPTSAATFPAYSNQYLYSANMRNGYVESWNLQVQRELGWATVFSVAYAGSMGVHLPVVRELNPAIYTPGSSTTANTNQRRRLGPALGSTSLLAPIAPSNYHALLLNVERHFQNNFSMMANYSFSKAMDISSQPKETGQSVTIPSDPRFDYGPADYDRRHVVNASTVWLIPGPHGSRLMREVLGGWEHTMIFNYTGGYPFSILSGQDNALTGTSNQRGNYVPGQTVGVSGHPSTGAVQWFNKAAFVVNPTGTYGDTGRNAYRGPGYTDFDMGLMKRFQLKERLNTTFRFETFNIFNHTNLGQPTNTVTSGNFGLITSASDPRILQFALRLNW